MKFKTVEEVAAVITVRNYLNMVLDNAGIKLPEGREESRRIKNLPGQIDQMIIASIGDILFKKESDQELVVLDNKKDELVINASKELPKKGSFKRTK